MSLVSFLCGDVDKTDGCRLRLEAISLLLVGLPDNDFERILIGVIVIGIVWLNLSRWNTCINNFGWNLVLAQLHECFPTMDVIDSSASNRLGIEIIVTTTVVRSTTLGCATSAFFATADLARRA